MNRKIAIKLNYMVGNILLAFTRNIGPYHESKRLERAYREMEEVRKEISDFLVKNVEDDEPDWSVFDDNI